MTTLTGSAPYADLLADLPAEIPALVQAVQGNLLHIFWADRYGVELSDARKAEVNIRPAAEMLRRIHQSDPAPMTVARPLEKKLVGNCRDFSVLMCALLRYQGIPARARCGFGTYFEKGKYEDHWICEYWHANDERWVQVDAQLDEIQRETLQIDFNTLDMPPGRFVSGGQAWQLCRDEGVDPDLFGIFDMHGLWFVLGDMVRDLAALNKMELLPWDGWGVMDRADEVLSEEKELAFLDRVAALTLAGNDSFGEMQTLYETDERLRVPPVIKSYASPDGFDLITLADEIAGN